MTFVLFQDDDDETDEGENDDDDDDEDDGEETDVIGGDVDEAKADEEVEEK